MKAPNISTVDNDNDGETSGGRERKLISYLVSWCFEPSQPLGVTSGLEGSVKTTTKHTILRLRHAW